MEPYRDVRALARRGALGHAYLIYGESAEERGALARHLAAALLCGDRAAAPCGVCVHCRKLARGIHPDLITVSRLPDKRDVTVEQIRDLAREAYVLPNEADKKVFFLPEGDAMNPSAQNALLKLLEEPPQYAAFLLLGANPGSFLKTVRSRCVELRAAAASPDAGGEDDAAAKLTDAFLAGDPLAFAEAALPLEKLDRERFDALLAALSLRAAARARAGAGETRACALRLAALVEDLRDWRRVYVSPGHCLGYLWTEIEAAAKR